MGLFCGDKCECKRRCKSQFSYDPTILKACKNACKSNADLSKEDFMCSGKYIDQQIFFGALGFDPCPGDSITIDNYLDPGGNREQEETQLAELKPVIFGLVAVLLIMILLYFYYR